MTDYPPIYISVQDGDITAWLIREGHAYPFTSAARAATAELVGADWPYFRDDVAFEALRTSDDVWWDREPPALGIGGAA